MFTSTMLCEHALDRTGVAMLPGAVFGRPSAEMTARLSFVDFEGGLALEAWRQAGRPDQVMAIRTGLLVLLILLVLLMLSSA